MRFFAIEASGSSRLRLLLGRTAPRLIHSTPGRRRGLVSGALILIRRMTEGSLIVRSEIAQPTDRLKVIVCLSPTNLLFIFKKTKSG